MSQIEKNKKGSEKLPEFENNQAPKELLSLATQTNLSYADISAGKLFEASSKNNSLMSNFVKQKEPGLYEVNFFNNINAENNIGLADVMPEEAKKVFVRGEKNGRTYNMIGTRQGLKGSFYDENGRYIPIFNGFKIQVLEAYTPEELKQKKEENEKLSALIMNNPKLESFNKKFPGELEKIVKKGIEYGIDANLLIALRQTENGRAGIDFGVMRMGIDTFEGQLAIACRIIQNNMNKFKRITKESPTDGNQFTGEFIAYLSNIYSPIGASNDPNGLNKNHLKNLLTFYSNYSGKDFGNLDELIAKSEKKSMEWDATSSTDSLIGTTNPDELIKSAHKHMGKGYLLGGNGNNYIDCSQLVIEALKDNGVVSQAFDTTAHNLSKFTKQKSPSDVQRGDLVFLQTAGHITHVEIALGPVENGRIPIIDASSNAGKVTTRYQDLNGKVVVGTPIFYA